MVSLDVTYINTLKLMVAKFVGGAIGNQIKEWKNITSDKYIINIIMYGLKLNFMSPPPGRAPFEYQRSQSEREIISGEIRNLLKKRVIEPCVAEHGEYFSNLFTAPKKDGTYRTILNLRSLNVGCNSPHFKMESLKQALHMVRKCAYMASIDIQDAFYSVPVHIAFRKY